MTNTEDGTTGTITEEMVENMVTTMVETKGLVPNPKTQHGRRVIGPRKMKLLMRLQDECIKLGRKGINADYALRKLTDWKGPLKTNTKKMSGIISQLRSFDK